MADDRGSLYIEVNPRFYTGSEPLQIKVIQRYWIYTADTFGRFRVFVFGGLITFVIYFKAAKTEEERHRERRGQNLKRRALVTVAVEFINLCKDIYFTAAFPHCSGSI